eukprot:TRINITY_DN14198_c0_g1_i1.p1 TRINITY_DN14198_c0_g1~~TRINITY_DN14198_c0_g1_i1.p1  ORF type:complete len:115 (-),score=47.92 TRINITY_DN14198_c0_g1_i1:14-358(-)
MSSPPETAAVPERKGQSKREVEDLNKVADDAVQDAENKKIDTASVEKLTTLLATEKKEDQAAQLQRQKELAAVKVNPADIDFVASEFEITKAAAELALRENKGDLLATLRVLVH